MKSSLISYTLEAGAAGLISRGALAVSVFNQSGADMTINSGTLPDGASLNLQVDGFEQDEINYAVDAAATGTVKVFEIRKIC